MRVKTVIHETKEGDYWAEVPALPGCMVEGKTRPELLDNLRRAVPECLLTILPAFRPVRPGREEIIEV